MISGLGYLRVCHKRSFKLLPFILMTAAIFVAVLGIAFFVMISANEELNLRVRIGLVGETDEEYLGIGVMALEELDSSRVAVQFIEYDDEDEAGRALKNNDISAYVYIPEGFIDDVVRGNNTPLTLVMADRTDDLIPTVVRSIADKVSAYVTESQRAIYAMQLCIERYDADVEDRGKITDELNLKFIAGVLDRASWAEVLETGEMGTSSYGGYYFCSFLFLLLMLFSVMATPLFVGDRDKRAYYRAYGVGSVKQVGAELLAYASVVLLLVLVLCIAVGAFLPEGLMSELTARPVAQMLGFFVKSLPFMLLILSVSFFFWELVPNTVNGVLLQFVLTIATGYISGCFYPSDMFPESVRHFASLLPTGVALEGIRDSLSGGAAPMRLFAAAGLFVLFFAAACLLRRYRLQMGGKE